MQLQQSGKQNRTLRHLLCFAGLLTAMVLLFFWNIRAGSVSLSAGYIAEILQGVHTEDTAYQIIWGIRLPRVLAAVTGTFLLSKPISAYQQGEAYARSVGVNTKRFRICLILLSGLLSACVTAFAGPISFVGIAVPHLMKSILGTSRPILIIPACFLGGAVCCLFCDLIARTVFAPTEVSISSVTAVFGAPVVIYMLMKRRKEC